MIDLVELTVLCQSIAQVNTHGLVDLPDLRLLVRLHCFLDQLEALRVILVLDGDHVGMRVLVVGRHLDTALGRQLRGATLSQVHVAQAPVGALGPRICGGLRVEVQAAVAKLADPAHKVPVCVGIAGTLAASHGNAHHIASFDLLHCGQGRDLSIVDDLQRHVSSDLLTQSHEDVHHLGLVHIRWDVRENVAPGRLIVGRHGPCCAATNGVDLG
mmetsp:Transcript_127998/g.180628  ORF Transcript_127998/g.180628 Transcript_127998/m.180628 type:complete len:214 (-) Transcript_127998:1246-1887(-)